MKHRSVKVNIDVSDLKDDSFAGDNLLDRVAKVTKDIRCSNKHKIAERKGDKIEIKCKSCGEVVKV